MFNLDNLPEPNNVHGSFVFVQVKDIGYCIPGIQIFCNKSSHADCRRELAEAIRQGGRIVTRQEERDGK